MWKSIKIKDDTKKMIDKLKVHQRQSYDEVIKKLAENEIKKMASDGENE